MKNSCVTVLFLLIASVLAAEETRLLPRTGTSIIDRLFKAGHSGHPLVLADDDSQLPVLVMEPLKSDALAKFFPQHTCFRLISSRDFLHGAKVSALFINTNGSPSHLQSDQQVAEFMSVSDLSRTIKTAADAKLLIQAFVDLRSYKIAQERPTAADPRKPDEIPVPLETDFKFLVTEKSDEWLIHVTLYTNEYGGCYMRCSFTIKKTPRWGISLAEPVLIHLESYVY